METGSDVGHMPGSTLGERRGKFPEHFTSRTGCQRGTHPRVRNEMVPAACAVVWFSVKKEEVQEPLPGPSPGGTPGWVFWSNAKAPNCCVCGELVSFSLSAS